MIKLQALLNSIKSLFSDEFDELYYINGSENLPPPLNEAEEREAVLTWENNRDSQQGLLARNKLVEHNLRLVVYIAKKFDNTGIGTEDLISIGTIGLVKAINTFKSEKEIKLATYASKCIENEILMFIRKSANQKGEISLDEPLNVDYDGNELLLCDILGSDGGEVERGIEEEEEREFVKRAVSRLNPRDKEIIELRFGMRGGDEMTQKEVADYLGISQSYISRLEKRIIEKLKKEVIM